MEISDGCVVTIQYSLSDADGNVLEQVGDEGLAYLQGHDNIVPGLESELEGKAAGDEFDTTLDPEAAYGEHMDELVSRVDRDTFPEDEEIEPGMVFQAVKSGAAGDEGEGSQFLVVQKIVGDEVVVDANHPLAGKTLNFAGEVLDVREATDDELDAHRPLE